MNDFWDLPITLQLNKKKCLPVYFFGHMVAKFRVLKIILSKKPEKGLVCLFVVIQHLMVISNCPQWSTSNERFCPSGCVLLM